MSRNMDTIVDGSLRNYEWYDALFQTLRKAYPSYKLVIVYVACSEAAMLARAARRAAETGRVVPPELLVAAHREMPTAVNFLTSRVNLVAHVSNEAGGDPKVRYSSLPR